MIVTLKTLQQETFTIEIDPSQTVRNFKEKIERMKGSEYAADSQKLIYTGKILIDDTKMSDYNIDEKKFVIIMVTKPKAALVRDCDEVIEKSSPSPTPPTGGTTSGTTSTPAAAEDRRLLNATEDRSSSVSAESPSSAGEDYQRMVSQIMEMGYGREAVEQALRVSCNNPDRAVECLLSGMFPSLVSELQEHHNLASANPSVRPNIPAGELGDPLAILRTQPQFQQMRQIVQQNPMLLNTVLQQIGQINPQLLQQISQNREAFIHMLNEPSDVSSEGSDQPNIGGSLASGRASVPISPQDQEAIERLKQLGFPEYLVVEAYFACDKNENSAADFLFSQNYD